MAILDPRFAAGAEAVYHSTIPSAGGSLIYLMRLFYFSSIVFWLLNLDDRSCEKTCPLQDGDDTEGVEAD